MSTRADLERALREATSDEARVLAQRNLDAFTRNQGPPPPPPPPDGPTGQPNGGGASSRARRLIAARAHAEAGREPNSMHYTPTLETIRGLELSVVSNAVASPDEVSQIGELWQAYGAPANSLGRIALDLALQCTSCGSSRFTELPGACPNWPQMPRSGAVGLVKKVCTLRRFCMYYAKVIWNILLEHQTPPVGWADRGFKEDTKYAAFDFFTGVLNDSALDPGHLVRDPTPSEIQANAANAAVAISDAVRAEGIRASTDVRITGGNIGNLPLLLPAPDD
uniref:CP n=1 Tax=Yucca alphaflexivirus 1 TaxID=2794423 RepID=A0A7T5UEX7_9VIRU|nr:CP [Yucca alphaflexivirus 1]